MIKLERNNNHHAWLTFEGLNGNGLIFARRETLRMARRLRLVACYGWQSDTIDIGLYSKKDEKRLSELWKYCTGQRFQRRILNNGWWRT